MDDRAQLMLIGAVVIAVAMLALVTVLNSTIYAQNVASGNTLDETRETNEQLQVVQRDVTRITERHQEKYGYVDEERLNESLQIYASHLTEQTAWRSPAYVEVGLNETEDADVTVLRQDWGSDLYPYGNNTNDWQLVDDGTLTGATPFEASVEMQDMGHGPSFHLDGGTGDEKWLHFRPGNGEVVFSDASGCHGEIPYSGDTVEVNVTAGTLDGSQVDCWTLHDDRYDVWILDAQHARNGSYTLTVEESDAVVDWNFADNLPGNPYTTTPITTAVVDVRYGTGSVSMDTHVEVTPE